MVLQPRHSCPRGRRATEELTCNEPAEEEEGRQRVPGGADPTEGVGRRVVVLTGARQAGQQRQGQAEDPRHDQIDGDAGFPGTVVQVDGTFKRPWFFF